MVNQGLVPKWAGKKKILLTKLKLWIISSGFGHIYWRNP